MTKAYFLAIASGVTVIDLPTCPILVGQHEVPLIPESDIMPVSETQARCFGIDIYSKSHCFGSRGSIFFDDDTTVPLHLENDLMTCPIQLPSANELNTLPIHWLSTDAAPWDPTEISEPLDAQVHVSLGYTSTLGTMDLGDLDLEFGDLGIHVVLLMVMRSPNLYYASTSAPTTHQSQ